MSKDYTDVLLEEMNGKFDRLIEVMAQMREEMKHFARQEDLEEVKADVKIIKAAVTDLSSQVNRHEIEIGQLKTAHS